MTTLNHTVRWEFRVSLVFALVWIGTITALVLSAWYASGWFASSVTDANKTAAVFACIANMVFVGTMYFLDVVLLKTNGLLSYWKWDSVKDEPPYATISICCTFFIAVMIIVVGADRLKTLTQFDTVVLQLVFAIAFVSILIILVQLNIFDASKVRSLDPANRERARKTAWYLYLYMIYAFAFSVILLATLYSSALGLLTNFVGALVLATYYYSRKPIFCRLTTDENQISAYDKLRSKRWPESERAQHAVVFTFKNRVIGGAQIHLSTNSEQRLPLERGNWDLRKALVDIPFDGRTIAEVNRFIVEKDFEGKGVTRDIIRELWRIAEEHNVDYVLVVASERPAKWYRKMGFDKLDVEYPFVSEHNGAKLDLLMLSVKGR